MTEALAASLAMLRGSCIVVGHAPYRLGLERGFERKEIDVRFESITLTQAIRSDLLGRVAYRLLTLRTGWRSELDWDYQRLRSEVASSLFLRRLLKRRLAANTPDVVHVHTQSIALLSADLLRAVPSVVSLDCTTALLARVHRPPAKHE